MRYEKTLFRLWDKENAKYIYSTDNLELLLLQQARPNDLVVEMCIGKNDKTGKRIFENDIVKWDDNSNNKFWRVAIVEMCPDIQFRIVENTIHILSTYEGDIFKFGSFMYTDTENHLLVVGNVNENRKVIVSPITEKDFQDRFEKRMGMLPDLIKNNPKFNDMTVRMIRTLSDSQYYKAVEHTLKNIEENK